MSIKVWADGYDRWHVSGTTNRSEAVEALYAEMKGRVSPGILHSLRGYLRGSIVELSPGHWVEWVQEWEKATN